MKKLRRPEASLIGLIVTFGMVLAPSGAWSEQARRPELIVLARLVRRAPSPPPLCGILHCAELMEYEVLQVERGASPGPRIFVAHGCPAMPRQTYNGPGAGSLRAFTVGEVHRLELSRVLPSTPGGPSVCAGNELIGAGQPFFWALRADPATP